MKLPRRKPWNQTAAPSDPKVAARIRAQAAMEPHSTAGSYLGNLVYGGLDGILTSFAVVSGVVGADLSTRIISIVGLANLFADGFAMAVGAYLSAQSQHEYYQQELLRERWEVEHIPDVEQAELYEIYRQRGYSEEDAGTLVRIHARDSERWVRAMMTDELGLLPAERTPLPASIVTFAAFVVAGLAPLLIYLIGLTVDIRSGVAFITAIVLGAAALFGLGAAKVLVTKRNAIRSGLEMLIVGGLAAGVAYTVGILLRGLA
ncbi:MAG: VIT1/CCC1 transporter family protein [Chloroflexi bacterium]|nr:VIT1/CCC1 transporter family protein [Chloroflexota bacterium]